MEKTSLAQFAKYYDKFDVLVSADNCILTIDFKVFKKDKEHNTKHFTMAGQIKAFELITTKSSLNEFYWLSIVLDLTEPTFYLWNYEIRPDSDMIKEISKLELGHNSFDKLFSPTASMTPKLYAVSTEILLEISLPEHQSKTYTLKEVNNKPNPHQVFDAFGSKIVIPSDSGFDIIDTDNGNVTKLWDKKAVMVKFSKNGKRIAVALEGVYSNYLGKKCESIAS